MTARLKVVIVDDHPSFRRVARELLQLRGYAVVGEADRAAAACEVVERLEPDAILLDVHLGEDDGVALARRLTSSRPGLSVLLVSTDDCYADHPCLRACGACGFVPKQELARADLASLWRGGPG